MRVTLLLTHDYSRSTVCRFSRFKKVYLREGERADGLPGRLETGTVTKTAGRPTRKHKHACRGSLRKKLRPFSHCRFFWNSTVQDFGDDHQHN